MVQPPLKQQKISHPAAQQTQEEKAAGGASPGAASSAPPEAGRDAPFDPRVHAGMLGIPVIEPTRPTKPLYHEIIGGGAVPLHTYIVALKKNVVWRLSAYLYNHPSIALRKPLYTQRTPKFESPTHGQRVAPTTYKEPWNMENCLTSLRTNGFYESSMTEWQFDSSLEKWEDVDLGVDNVSWTQYEACDGLWSNAVLVSSAEDPDTLGRFIFPGFIPTAGKSTDVIQEMVNVVTSSELCQPVAAMQFFGR